MKTSNFSPGPRDLKSFEISNITSSTMLLDHVAGGANFGTSTTA